ncbi:MAG TPA: RNA-binding transcriptional accessory protein [Planctomycetaceae bacterium]|nr:RNA-binding transcriptional accessory protein [Blastopirellula sp.]HAY80823.1 RNA-binding transcriptional accessory protein [Planctomycetaceae bacterium]
MDSTLPINTGALANSLGLAVEQVARAVELLDDGNTVPFITRYRKDQTGGLDEEQIREVQAKLVAARQLAERKLTILKSIESQQKLTPQLARLVENADTTKRLEDLYLPFKPKKQTRAEQAREKGLEPFAREILSGQDPARDLESRAADYLSPEHELNSTRDVLAGVTDLIAEFFSEHADLRDKLRHALRKHGKLVSGKGPAADVTAQEQGTGAERGGAVDVAPVSPGPSVAAEAADESSTSPAAATETEPNGPDASNEENEGDAAKAALRAQRRAQRKSKKEQRHKKLVASFTNYFEFEEPLGQLPHHRVLAINRGEKARVLRVKLDCDVDLLTRIANETLVDAGHPHAEFLLGAIPDVLGRLLLPSLERELRREMTDAAEQHAIDVFAVNLRKLLLQPPVCGRRVLAIDPGFRSGCKAAVLNEFGMPLAHAVVFVVGKEEKIQAARKTLAELIQAHEVSAIAIGNGTASREVEQLVSSLLGEELQSLDISYVMVNEAGASVYSTSELGREELPELDPVHRSAVSIGRRLLDPLSELVKINPSNIGVGLYQHDLKAKHLRDSLDAVVESCVNYVGVDVNTASPALLRYVSGLNQLKARRLVEYRQERGPFRTREEIKAVPNIGEATFVQAAGFLKVNAGTNPLDATWIHPESYDVAQQVLSKIGEVPQSAVIVDKVEETPPQATDGEPDVAALSGELGVGEWTLRDILLDLTRPSRDPREDFEAPAFRRGIMKLDDLSPGMEVPGTVSNVVDFGAFVDIGLSDSGLVHISRLSRNYVKSPHEVVSVGDKLRLWVLEIDKQRRRVSLTAIEPGTEPTSSQGKRAEGRPAKSKSRSARKPKAASRGAKQSKAHGAGAAKKRRKSEKPKPVKPITQGMEEGTEPMRTFSDLMQFYDKKKPDSQDQ